MDICDRKGGPRLDATLQLVCRMFWTLRTTSGALSTSGLCVACAMICCHVAFGGCISRICVPRPTSAHPRASNQHVLMSPCPSPSDNTGKQQRADTVCFVVRELHCRRCSGMCSRQGNVISRSSGCLVRTGGLCAAYQELLSLLRYRLGPGHKADGFVEHVYLVSLQVLDDTGQPRKQLRNKRLSLPNLQLTTFTC